MNIPEGILCAKSHEWIIQEGDYALVGLSDWRILDLGDIVFIELPEAGLYYQKDEVFATIESVREACEIYMPVEGEVVEVNERLINSPELINENPYEAWFIKIKPADFQNDSQGLLEYSDYIEEVS